MSAYNGSGVFTLTGPEYPAVAASLIQSAYRNALDSAIATGLSTAICRDGQSVITANIPFNGFKLTGIGAAAARTDAASLATIQDATGVYVAIVGGTANAITLTPTPSIAAYAAGQRFQFIASGTNSTTVVVDVSSLGAKLVTKHGTTSLVSGDILSGALVQITYDGTRFQLDYAIAMTQAEIGLTLYPQTAAELSAGVTPTAYQYAPGDVRRYGGGLAASAGTNATAIQNAINGNNLCYLSEEGTYSSNGTISVTTGQGVIGVNERNTILSYTGAAQAFVNATPGTRIYNLRFEHFTLIDVGTGTVGLDFDSVSESSISHVVADGFTTGFRFHAASSGFSVYNRAFNCKAQNATTGFLIDGLSSNAHVLFACRGNICTLAVDIVDSNENHVIASQFESGTNGVRVTTSAGSSARNYIESNRFENNSGTNITVGSASCSDTLLFANYHATGTAYADSGLRTQFFDMYPNAAGLPMLDLITPRASTDGCYKFKRTVAATAIPVFVISDTNAGSGTPDQLWLVNERGTGFYQRLRRGGNDIAFWNAAGALQIAGTAPTVAAAQVGLGATTSTTVGAAGGAAALPATPTGYWILNIAGTAFKVPYFAT